MKKIFLFSSFLLCFVMASKSQVSYLDYPHADSVYTRFFHHYSVTDLQDRSMLQFQKKPDGWHVVEYTGGYDSIERDELFWSSNKKSYQPISFDAANPETAGQNIEFYKRDFKNYDFSFFPYFNYVGCDWDVIKYYGDKKNLPDSILYALGRSYSYYAENLINNNSGFSDKSKRFKLGDGPNALSPEQLATYRKYEDLAIETFKEVKKLNPNYETMVGDIGLKLANEYMVKYLDMQVYQNEEEARKELKDNIYDYTMLSVARDYLASCDSNAILITYGDNDSYPLLYLQAHDKFRTDVLIVNNELISLPRYINSLRRPFNGSNPLQLSIGPDQYKEGVRDYLFYFDSPKVQLQHNANPMYHSRNEYYYNLSSVMDFMFSEVDTNKIELSNGTYVNYYPVNKFSLPVNKENVRKSKLLTKTEINNAADEIEWKFNGTYMLKGNLILLNMLLNNDWKRPICFTNGADDQYLGLERYFRIHGLVFELIPIQNYSSDPFETPMVATNFMYDLTMNKMMWGGYSSGGYFGTQKQQLASNLRLTTVRLATKLVADNKLDSARRVLKLCMDSIPEKNCPFTMYDVPFEGLFYQVGDNKMANEVSNKLFDLCEKDLQALGAPDKVGNKGALSSMYLSNMSLVKNLILVISKLCWDASDYKQSELAAAYYKRAKVLFNKGLIDSDTFARLPNQ